MRIFYYSEINDYIKNIVLILIVLALTISIAQANTSTTSNIQDIAGFKQAWSSIKYPANNISKSEQIKQLEGLVAQLDQYARQKPNDAATLLWQGTLRSTLASLKGGLGALSLAKEAKQFLEKSLAVDPTVEHGYAHVILGALFQKVPGKPLGFGSKEIARHHFLTALQMDPNGLESNFFFGEYLIQMGDHASAKGYLEKAARSAVDQQFMVFEQGRRDEVQKALKQISRPA